MLVLLVDDDADLRGALGETLRRNGMDVLEAADGREALVVLTAAHPGLVITDLLMPVMCGEDLVGEMVRDRQLACIPVLRMTATPEARRSAAPCLTKPFSTGELLQAIRDAVAGGAGGRW